MVKALALVLLLPCLALAAAAQVPVIDHPVVDQAGLLSAPERERVAGALVDLRARTGAQMAVLLVDTTSGEPIEDYSIRVARQWRGGQAGGNNGLLFVLAVKDRRMRLDVGYGLEEFLPDDAVRSLLDAQLPLMRQKDFAGALVQIIGGVGERLPVQEGAVDARAPTVPGAPRVDAHRVIEEAFLWGIFMFVVCALMLRPSMYRWMGPQVAALMCSLLLGLPVVFILHRAVGNEALIFKVLLPLVMGGGLFFLGRSLVVNTSWMRWGACLMVGSLLALLACVGKPEEASLQFVLLFSCVLTFICLFSSFMMVGNLLVVPWMFAFGSKEIVQRWWWPAPGRSYSSSSYSPDASSSSWLNLSSSSSSSSSYDSSSSSSSSSYDSSSSSSSSSDWGGGGGDFGGGGSSSSW